MKCYLIFILLKINICFVSNKNIYILNICFIYEFFFFRGLINYYFINEFVSLYKFRNIYVFIKIILVFFLIYFFNYFN